MRLDGFSTVSHIDSLLGYKRAKVQYYTLEAYTSEWALVSGKLPII